MVFAVSLLFVLRACVIRPGTDRPASAFNTDRNAVWLGIEWVNDAQTDAAIRALAAELRSNRIRDVFVYVSYLRRDGQFGRTFEKSENFLRLLKEVAPEVRVQAWIGVPLKNLSGGYADLGDPSTRRAIADLCAELARERGFAGVHLDPEIIESGNQDFLRLLKEVHLRIDQGVILSVAAHAWWTPRYIREVAQVADQIAVMSYDSALPFAFLYTNWLRLVVVNWTRALDGWSGDLFISIPVSEEWSATHNLNSENVVSGLQGLRLGLNDLDARPNALTGIAIYPYWDMNAEKWQIYRRDWLGVNP